MELAVLGAGLACHGTEQAKDRERLESAAGEASTLNAFLTIAGHAKQAVGDQPPAESLLAKVEEKAKIFDDYVNLARTRKAEGADEAAARLYAKAARYCSGMDATVACAKDYDEILGNQLAAKNVLKDAETDCQLPKDFAALAADFKDLFGDDAKASELMERAVDFAMIGEENLDLAKGYRNLLGGQARALRPCIWPTRHRRRARQPRRAGAAARCTGDA